MNTKTTPKDFFLNLGSIIALYITIVSFISLAYALIGKFFPDTATYYGYDDALQTIRWSVSALIVAFPLHIYLLGLIKKDIILIPEKKNLWIKKWSTYLTLFLTGLTIAIDVIVLIYNFLGGDITSQFISKIIVVLLVSLFVFIFHIHDLRQNDYVNDKKSKSMIIFATLIVSISIILGFIKVGSPIDARLQKLDDQRVQDLSSIGYQITNYWQKTGMIPSSLSVLNDPLSSYAIPKDPETGNDYEYIVKGKKDFDLCANFGAESNKNLVVPIGGLPNFYSHNKGRTCFERTIDPLLYPVIK